MMQHNTVNNHYDYGIRNEAQILHRYSKFKTLCHLASLSFSALRGQCKPYISSLWVFSPRLNTAGFSVRIQFSSHSH